MSSHHIVREKQEPALLVLSLSQFTDEELGQLLEWSPSLIATVPVAEQLTVYGIKVDYVITDDAHQVLQSDVKLIPANKQPVLQAALIHLVTQGYPAVNIITDCFDLPVYETFAGQINIVVFYNRQKIYAINSGFRKWKPAAEYITILTPGIALQTEGLHELSAQHYQTQTDGFFSLTFDADRLFIAEEY